MSDRYVTNANQRSPHTVSIGLEPSVIPPLIGQGGHRINSIKAKTGARICINGNSVEVSGEHPQIHKAMKLINKQIGRSTSSETNYKTSHPVVIAIEPSKIGKFIAKGGHRINAMKEETGASIAIHENSIKVSGNHLQIQLAVQLINKQIGRKAVDVQDNERSTYVDTYDNSNLELTVNRNKLKLSQIDSRTTVAELQQLIPDTKTKPNVLVK